jgi:hypothetical protein
MKGRTWWSIGAFLVLGTTAAAAQPPTPPAPRAPPAPPSVRVQEARRAAALELAEYALRLRERLALTEDQVARLESLRQEEVGRRVELEREREELRSRQRAGYEDAGLRERLEQLRAAERAAAAERRALLDGILTETQRDLLMSRRVRAVGPRVRSELAPRALRIRPAPRAPGGRLESRSTPRIRLESRSTPRIRLESRSTPRSRLESRPAPLAPAAPFLRRTVPRPELRGQLPATVRLRRRGWL